MDSQVKKTGLALLSDDTLAAIVEAGTGDEEMTPQAQVAFDELVRRDN